MTEDEMRTVKDVLAAIMVTSAYQNGVLNVEHHDTLAKAKRILAEQLPGAADQLRRYDPI